MRRLHPKVPLPFLVGHHIIFDRKVAFLNIFHWKWPPFQMLHEGLLQTLGTKLMNDIMGEHPN